VLLVLAIVDLLMVCSRKISEVLNEFLIYAQRHEREERHKSTLESKIGDWDPNSDEKAEGDPFKTLFVGRINYDSSESKLRREFEQYGPIKKINLVTNPSTGKLRGYVFIIYEKERDMHAYV
jgi:U1 small nuclear ribonucleoprotein